MQLPYTQLAIALDETTKDIILVVLVILIFIWVVARLLMWFTNRKDGEKLSKVWRSFRKAVKNEDVEGINQYGRDLIYNSYVTEAQLRLARRMVNKSLKKHPELGELSLLIFNKCLGQ